MSDARFSIIPGWIVTDPRLKGRDLQVLCLLGRHTSRKHGWCRRSQVKMAEELSCARSTVQASIDRLVEIGGVERREVISESGRDSAHWYRVIYDVQTHQSAFSEWDALDVEEFGPIEGEIEAAPPCRYIGTPAGISAPPAGPGSAPPADSGPAPINDSCLTPPAEREEREGAGARAGAEKKPMSYADLVKRVQRFVSGDGYQEGEWPKWSSSTIGHIAKQFAQLSEEEQDRACEFRDVFLAKCKRDKVARPMPVANYFRDRVWEMLEKPAVKPAARPEKVAAAPFGPLMGAVRAWLCLQGPDDGQVPLDVRDAVMRHYEGIRRNPVLVAGFLRRKGLSLDAAGELIFPPGFDEVERRHRLAESGYPAVNKLHEQIRNRQPAPVDSRFMALKDLCEPVPVESSTFAAWLAHDERVGWPRLPDPGAMDVVWLPKGGPGGLGAFEQAASERLSEAETRGDEHAA